MKLFVDNFSSVGTQAALLAGFAFTSLAELNVPDDAPKPWKLLYFISVTITLASSLHCLVSTTIVNLFGPALALRSNDVRALERTTAGMYDERRQIFAAYWTGLISFQVAVIAAVWLVASETNPWVCFVCSVMLLASIVAMAWYARRIYRNFVVKKDDSWTTEELEPGIARDRSRSSSGRAESPALRGRRIHSSETSLRGEDRGDAEEEDALLRPSRRED